MAHEWALVRCFSPCSNFASTPYTVRSLLPHAPRGKLPGASLWCTAAVSLGPPPKPPAPLTAPTLPLLSMLAPVALSVVMAIVFGSPLALMMGALGPLMMWGGWWESRRQGRLHHARECDDYDSAVQERGDRVASLRRTVMEEATRSHRSVEQWAADPLWRGPRARDSMVRVGYRLWGPPSGHPLADEGAISGIPGLVDSTAGLAFVAGDDARDLWRALLVQWRAHTTAGWVPRLDTVGDELPRDARGSSRIIWVATVTDVPDDCAVVIIHREGRQALVHSPDAAPWSVVLDQLSHAQGLWALRLITRRPIEGSDAVTIDPQRRDQLWMTLSPGGPAIDVVAQGPHALVWGATGSGKSQTVVTLVLSLAATYTPQQLVCVVIDFKGGAGLRPLMDLSHTIGCVTDIGHTSSIRALRGLQAELIRRERLLADHGVPECSALPGEVVLPRLIVVIDEAAWLFTNHPEWAEGLHDVLARGRSLGVHIILSTQRVAGVIPRAMMANIALRLCGRVSDAGELAEWMPDAPPSLVTTMRHCPVGQVVLAGGTQAPVLCDVSPTPVPINDVSPSSWRIWVDPLPPTSPWCRGQWALEESEDSLEHTFSESPLGVGTTLVVGDSGSGRTGAARALGLLAPGAVMAPAHPAGLYACLLAHAGTGMAVVSDNCDAIIARAGSEGEVFLLECLQEYGGPAVLVCRPSHRLARHLSRLAPQTLVMSMSKPEYQDLWGTPKRTTPGSALWQGREVQVLYPVPELGVWMPTCVPSVKPAIVLDPESTITHWQTAVVGAPDTDVVFVNLTYRQVRLESGGRLWVPPLPLPGDCVWVWRGGEPVLANSVDWLR